MLQKITGFFISNKDREYDSSLAGNLSLPNFQKITVSGNILWLWGNGEFSPFIRQLANRIQIIVNCPGNELAFISAEKPDDNAVVVNFYSDRIDINKSPNNSFEVFQCQNGQDWWVSSNKDLLPQITDDKLCQLDVLSGKRREYKTKIDNSDKVKLVIGAGGTLFEGWISTEYPAFDVRKEKHWQELFCDRLIDNILAEHVFEHLSYEESLKAWRIAFDFMKPGARMRIAVPEKNHPSQYYRDLVKPNGLEHGADDHKFFWGYAEMALELFKIGYKVDVLEFFDESGLFHSKNWSIDDGYISRSKRFSKGQIFTESQEEYDKFILSVPEHLRKQFPDNNITYTSLIVDAIK